MKRLLCTVLALTMVLALTACGSKTQADPAADGTDTSSTAAPVTTASGGSGTTEPSTSEENVKIYPDDRAGTFVSLVEKCGGIELHFTRTQNSEIYLGGKGNTYWMMSNDDESSWLHYSVYKDGEWDEHTFNTADGKTVECDTDTSVVDRICDILYCGNLVVNDSPVVPTDCRDKDLACKRYNYNFGEYSYDIYPEYNITVRYSNTVDPDAGFEFDYLKTGDDVKPVELPTVNS